jgi:hypothetical protein
MNRSSIRKSFLDDLLGESESTATAAATTASPESRQPQHQKTKSVRFREEGDDSDDILGSLIPNPLSAASPSSSGRDAAGGLKMTSVTPSIPSTSSSTKQQDLSRSSVATTGNPSDWLGLSDERPKSDPNRSQEKGKADFILQEEGFEDRMSASRKRESIPMKLISIVIANE